MKTATSPSWADDLCHPLPLAAVLVLAANDHLLKGSGLLPGLVTGKLSDFAGLFFFPLLLAALTRGSVRLAGQGDLEDRRALAVATTVATGAAFTLLKLCAPFNAWVTGVWGVNSMDATDLLALPMLPLSAVFMLRGAGRRAREVARPSSARRWLDLAAVVAAALASMATSAPPPQHVPQPPPAAAVAMADPEACASLALKVCESSPSETFVVVEATGVGPRSCKVGVAHATGTSAAALGPADKLPAPVVVRQGETATFSLSFHGSGDPAPQSGAAVLELEVDRELAGAQPKRSVQVLTQACVRR